MRWQDDNALQEDSVPKGQKQEHRLSWGLKNMAGISVHKERLDIVIRIKS